MAFVQEDNCPWCACKIDCGTNVNDSSIIPKEGDLSVCLYCGGYLKYGPQMRLVMLLPHELLDLDEDTRHQLDTIRRTILYELRKNR